VHSWYTLTSSFAPSFVRRVLACVSRVFHVLLTSLRPCPILAFVKLRAQPAILIRNSCSSPRTNHRLTARACQSLPFPIFRGLCIFSKGSVEVPKSRPRHGKVIA